MTPSLTLKTYDYRANVLNLSKNIIWKTTKCFTVALHPSESEKQPKKTQNQTNKIGLSHLKQASRLLASRPCKMNSFFFNY